MNNRKIFLIFSLLFLVFTLSACGRKTETPAAEEEVPVSVKGRTVAESFSYKEELEYPGTIVSKSEANVMAKASGNLSAANFKVGDKVMLGQELAKIDDVNSASFNPSNYNTNQIKQAQIAVNQAEAAYNLAKSSYSNLLVSSVRDLRSAEISRDQAAKGQSNLEMTTAESLKSAELAYDTAKIAVSQASSTLLNRQKLAEQSARDADTNAENAIDAAVSTIGAIITNINNATALDDNNTVSISYRSNLGALDSGAYDSTKQSYQAAKSAYAGFKSKQFANLEEKLDAAAAMANKAKELTDNTKTLFDKTVTSTYLPQTSLAGVSLSGLQSAAAGYQTQIAGVISQIDGAGQALANTDLSNNTLLDSLRQAYELALKQQASAEQSLNSLKAGNTSQKDQAGYAYNLAQNQYDNTKVKIETQISSAKTQMETAEYQYKNALASLQNMYDAHSVIAPLTGTITKALIANGEAVAAGQTILTVSQTQEIKVEFYIDQDNLPVIKLGQAVKVTTDGSKYYDGIIAAISPQADALTRRFLVEVELEQPDGLLLGTVATVKLTLEKTASSPAYTIVPLTAVTVGQNGSYIFIADNGQAKKATVEIGAVVGELVEIKTGLSAGTVIITDGNKLLQEGQAISLIRQ